MVASLDGVNLSWSASRYRAEDGRGNERLSDRKGSFLYRGYMAGTVSRRILQSPTHPDERALIFKRHYGTSEANASACRTMSHWVGQFVRRCASTLGLAVILRRRLGRQQKARVLEGYTALNMHATASMYWIGSSSKAQAAVETLAEAREASGYGVDIAFDFHGRVHRALAQVLANDLESFKPLFIGESVLPENNEALLEFAKQTTIPIDTGERMYTSWSFKSLLASGVVDILQPDLGHARGI
jgi:enolase-like protein